MYLDFLGAVDYAGNEYGRDSEYYRNLVQIQEEVERRIRQCELPPEIVVRDLTYFKHPDYEHLIDRSKLRRGQKQVSLPNKASQVLAYLERSPDRVVPRPNIMRAIWGSEDAVSLNNLSVNIVYLRRGFKELGVPDPIVTYPKVGYGITTHR